ncbi:hypothetical protein [Ruegeria sp. Ofav3-42]|uniref:hypothetical protein n=1 Tax=Ruegeria sp. Ofav3-42 TaxID=2917759 RepID=UPI001EF69E53|nr:hypothetical protein [Ruegeria sp. Ofav3-42]MCG7519208.1 hypothetical protein [Ruegeria sp. Ofav3-42]
MKKTADLKMAALAAMILVASALSGKDDGHLGEAKAFFMEAPRIETRILAG